MGRDQFGSILETIKAKVMGSLKRKAKNKKSRKKNEGSSSSSYKKMDKTASVRVEIQSRQARQLIDKTLMAADRPGKAYIP